jgi:hypothetical protein
MDWATVATTAIPGALALACMWGITQQRLNEQERRIRSLEDDAKVQGVDLAKEFRSLADQIAKMDTKLAVLAEKAEREK